MLYHFTILVRDANPSMEALEDRLFEAGCDDALLCFHNQTVYLEFDREAETAKNAIQSAISDIQSAGFYDLVLQDKAQVEVALIQPETLHLASY